MFRACATRVVVETLVLVALVGCEARDTQQGSSPPATAPRDVPIEPARPGRIQVLPDFTPPSTPSSPSPPAPPPPPPPGRRDVAPEVGVPFDQAVLGPLPHPFGALEALTPGATRDDVLSLVPTAQRDAKDNLTVALGVEGLVAEVTFDFTNHLDWVRVALPETLHPMLTRAWGKALSDDDGLVWFDRTKRWRADLATDDKLLTIGRYVPIAEQFGKGPDGLVDAAPIIGRSLEEVRKSYGDRISAVPLARADHWRQGIEEDEELWGLHLPATDVCKYFTDVVLVVRQGVVTRIELWQCVAATSSRGVSLRGFEKAWGRAVPARGQDDLPIFSFSLPRRLVELRWENGGWVGIIRPR